MRRRLLWVLLIGIALALAVTIARNGHDAPIAGLPIDDLGGIAYYIILAVFVGGAVLVLFRERAAQALEALLFWIVIGVVVLFAYTYRGDLQDVGERIMAELAPGRAAQRDRRTVEIVRGRGGDFQVAARVNDTRVAMALDTGASAVVLTHEAAKAVGLPIEMLDYSVRVDTANGRARAASITLDRLAVGDIVEHHVPALVAQAGQLRVSLLGMSFLNRLQSWEVRGDRLMMRGKPQG